MFIFVNVSKVIVEKAGCSSVKRLAGKIVSKVTYYVCSGTLNLHTQLFLVMCSICVNFTEFTRLLFLLAQVLKSLRDIQSLLTRPSNLRVHMAAHLDRLSSHLNNVSLVNVWINEFVPSEVTAIADRLLSVFTLICSAQSVLHAPTGVHRCHCTV